MTEHKILQLSNQFNNKVWLKEMAGLAGDNMFHSAQEKFLLELAEKVAELEKSVILEKDLI